MKVITQCGILFAVCLVGLFLSRLFPFPMPASVCAMLVLFALLIMGVLKVESLDEVAGFLLTNMSFFFTPLGVGILAHMDVIRGNELALIAVFVLTTFLTFGAAAGAARLAARWQDKIRAGRRG